MQVEVTQDDIDQGCVAQAYNCPVARALNRATGETDWSVCQEYAARYADLEDGADDDTQQVRLAHAYMPEAVGKFVTDFDNGCPVEPFTFDFDYQCPDANEN